MSQDTYRYVVVLTDDGRLKVNGASVAAPADIDASDSEAVLRWALDSTQQQHEALGGTMNLTVRDLREGGYGDRTTTLRPGGRVSIDSLRRAAGRRYESPAARPGLATAIVSADEPEPEPEVVLAAVPQQTLTPEPALIDEGATVQPPPVSKLGLDQPAPAPEVTRPAKATAAPTSTPQHHQAADEGSEVAAPVSTIPTRADWIVAEPRAAAPRRERAPKVREKTGRRSKRGPLIATACVLAVAAGGVVAAKALQPDVYVRVCVDERIDQRVPDDAACQSGSPHFVWWYVPEGEKVPAVGHAPSVDAGSYSAPDNDDAPVSTGFAESGGAVKEPERG